MTDNEMIEVIYTNIDEIDCSLIANRFYELQKCEVVLKLIMNDIKYLDTLDKLCRRTRDE